MKARLLILVLLLLACSYSTTVSAQIVGNFTSNFQFVKHKDNENSVNHSRFYNRIDGIYYIMPWLIGGAFMEMFKLGNNLRQTSSDGNTRWSFGGLVGIQKASWIFQLLLGRTDDKKNGLTVQLEMGYLFPISQDLYIGPKLSLRTYKIDDVTESFWEPTAHVSYWF